MSAKYIFRLDDICENMHWKNFHQIKEIFQTYNVKPIIGVIPKNEDEELLKFSRCQLDFWSEMKKLKYSDGWDIAVHGYNHVYENEESGLLKINNRSEFAGLAKERQNEKIRNALKVFNEKEIEVNAFMAPSHSFDETTIECLIENGINVITDGYAFYPYYEYGVLFVPQLFSKPRKMPFGIYTWCLHLNEMTEESLKDLESFIEHNQKDIISFSEANVYTIGNLTYKIQNFFLKHAIRFLRGSIRLTLNR